MVEPANVRLFIDAKQGNSKTEPKFFQGQIPTVWLSKIYAFVQAYSATLKQSYQTDLKRHASRIVRNVSWATCGKSNSEWKTIPRGRSNVQEWCTWITNECSMHGLQESAVFIDLAGSIQEHCNSILYS